MRSAVYAALAWGALATTGCEGVPRSVLEDAREVRLKREGIETFDSNGVAPLAGVSALRIIEVEPLDRRSLGSDTLSQGFRTFVMRCRACHEVPDPRALPAYQWPGVMSRMKRNIEKAGLIPIPSEEERAVLDFLQRHGGR